MQVKIQSHLIFFSMEMLLRGTCFLEKKKQIKHDQKSNRVMRMKAMKG